MYWIAVYAGAVFGTMIVQGGLYLLFRRSLSFMTANTIALGISVVVLTVLRAWGMADGGPMAWWPSILLQVPACLIVSGMIWFGYWRRNKSDG